MKNVTFSFDDGVFQDKKIIEIFDEYGIKGTFNLNSGMMTPESSWDFKGKRARRIDISEVPEVYKNHEPAVHFLTHPFPTKLSDEELDFEILEDKKNLERIFEREIVGSAYPYGEFDERTKAALKKHGIKYARTVTETFDFKLPSDPFELNPTCHYNNAKLFELAKAFVEDETNEPTLFYVWGHGYELDGYDNWDVLKRLCKYLSKQNNIFFGTNSEVFKIRT